jgi:prepilin-type N-terminal cleavage/methylation domain-containing protein
MKISRQHFCAPQAAFTMMEIAICLAIIGIALVAIIGDLPMGMNVQRDNREQTIINQDATIFIEAIRNGERGSDDLTNYVYQILNYQTEYSPAPGTTTMFGYSNFISGTNIVGLLSVPKYQPAGSGNFFSNHIVAYVRSMSGPAVEKPPQDNPLLVGDSFGYRIICDNVPVQTDNNNPSSYNNELAQNLHELRLTFLWPQQPNGSLGSGRQTFRALIAGQLRPDANLTNLFFYQPQSFTNAP